MNENMIWKWKHFSYVNEKYEYEYEKWEHEKYENENEEMRIIWMRKEVKALLRILMQIKNGNGNEKYANKKEVKALLIL